MKPEIAKIWTDALLSGEYEQCRGVLSRNSKYCCLGVLCELAIKNGVKLIKSPDSGSNDFTHYSYMAYNGCTMNLPDEVKEWAGMKYSGGGFFQHGRLESLAEMNDEGKSFKSIAKIIKRYVNEL